MFRKKSKVKAEEQLKTTPLTLSLPDETVLAEFPPDLVNSIRYLITRLMFTDQLSSTLSIVSSLRSEGVTYISRAVAATLANDLDTTVCLVELNWWWPDSGLAADKGSVSEGIAAVLAGQTSLSDAIMPTNYANLSVLPSGTMPLRDRPVWARSPKLQEQIDALSRQYDHLILDIPAILATSDAIPLASLAGTCCFVVNQGVTPLESARQALAEIDHLAVAGVVMNKVHIKTPSWLLNFIPQDSSALTSIN